MEGDQFVATICTRFCAIRPEAGYSGTSTSYGVYIQSVRMAYTYRVYRAIDKLYENVECDFQVSVLFQVAKCECILPKAHYCLFIFCYYY